MATNKIWRAVIGTLEDVHGEPGTKLLPGVIVDLIERVEVIEQLYIANRILPSASIIREDFDTGHSLAHSTGTVSTAQAIEGIRSLSQASPGGK